MKIFELLRKVECGDMTLLYMKEGEKVMFTMVPAGMEAQIATHRRSLRKTLGCRGAVRALGCDFPAVRPESLVQFKAAATPIGTTSPPAAPCATPAASTC